MVPYGTPKKLSGLYQSIPSFPYIILLSSEAAAQLVNNHFVRGCSLLTIEESKAFHLITSLSITPLQPFLCMLWCYCFLSVLQDLFWASVLESCLSKSSPIRLVTQGMHRAAVFHSLCVETGHLRIDSYDTSSPWRVKLWKSRPFIFLSSLNLSTSRSQVYKQSL